MRYFSQSNEKQYFQSNVRIHCSALSISFCCSYYSQICISSFVPDDESATVQGIITKEGLFEGVISILTDDYHVEPVSRYLRSNATQQPSSFHSIVYKSSDVKDPREGTPCASQHLYLNNIEKNTIENRKRRRKRWLLEAEAKLPYDVSTFWHSNKTKHFSPPTFDLNQPIDEELDLITSNRTTVDVSGLIFRNVNKRAIIDPKKTTCMLYLQADHQFFQKYGTEEACIEVMTRHVQRVNSIYKATGNTNMLLSGLAL